MIKVTPAQLSKIHVLLGQMGMMEEKKNIVSQFTNGRETSSKEMSMNEAMHLLEYLSKYDPLDRVRKKVFALAYEAGFIWGDSPEDKRMNSAKLDKFFKEKGAVKKSLNRMDAKELSKTVAQFQQIVKHQEETEAGKSVKSLLARLNISVDKTRAAKAVK